jgi:hypothetical protein
MGPYCSQCWQPEPHPSSVGGGRLGGLCSGLGHIPRHPDGGQRGDIEDVFLFEVLKGCVDPSTQTVLKALRQKTPDLSFEKAWQQMERTNAYDPVGARRKEWERVALKGGELTLATWRSYQSSFELTWARAEGISERRPRTRS